MGFASSCLCRRRSLGQGAFWWDQLYRALQFAKASQIKSPLGCLPLRTSDERNHAMDLLRAYVKESPFDQARRAVESLCASVGPDVARARSHHARLG